MVTVYPNMSTMTTTQAAEHFDVSTKTIRRWIRSGKLQAERIDGRWVVHESVCDGLQDAQAHGHNGDHDRPHGTHVEGTDSGQEVTQLVHQEAHSGLHDAHESVHIKAQLERANLELAYLSKALGERAEETQRLHKMLTHRDEQVDTLQRALDQDQHILAMQTKTNLALTEQLQTSQQLIEDLRKPSYRKGFWSRLLYR